jgi:CheY-like chemotaxis protein
VTSVDVAPVDAQPRVVIADDEVHVLDLVAAVVEELGCHVIRASNGETALSAVLEHMPALVVSDVMMPRLRGDEMCRRLKQNARTARIPVVLLTSVPKRNVQAVGADAFIAKPFDVAHVQYVVRTLLGNNRVSRIGEA